MQRIYYPIEEGTAKTAHEMRSFEPYKWGTVTARYQELADGAWELAERVARECPEKAEAAHKMAERYARRMAENLNKANRIGTRCPSILIAGPAGVDSKKKERQCAAYMRNETEYHELQKYLEKIAGLLDEKNSVLSKDADAVERLEKKVKALSDLQEHMKAVNAYFKKHGTLQDCPDCTAAEGLQLMQDMEKDWHLEKRPFQTFELRNNSQNLRATQKRLEGLKSAKNAGNGEIITDFFKVVKNAEIMRLQLFFDEKPDTDTRMILKRYGFHWSPSNSCWQRQLNQNGLFAIKKVLEALKENKNKEK